MTNLSIFEKANYTNKNIGFKELIKNIETGFELQNNLKEQNELSSDEKLKYTESIILTPDYQREYRFSIKDESSLIESVLLDIPIPPVFLASDRLGDIRVTNVVDGQHRLRAMFRFYNNEFKISGLKLLPGINGKMYQDLDYEHKEKLLTNNIAAILFDSFPGLDFELEIFNRYNKGTKPLSPQEIRHAVYNSEFNQYVNSFVSNITESEESTDSINYKLGKIYNTSVDRFQKKKVQENIFVILYIIEKGINIENLKSHNYAENFMKEKAEKERDNYDKALTEYEEQIQGFENFNEWILNISETVEFPFSKEIYGVSNRNYKFQISIAMIISGIYHKIIQEDKRVLLEKENTEELLKKIGHSLENSFLEDLEYRASSTNSKKIKELVDQIVL